MGRESIAWAAPETRMGPICQSLFNFRETMLQARRFYGRTRQPNDGTFDRSRPQERMPGNGKASERIFKIISKMSENIAQALGDFPSVSGKFFYSDFRTWQHGVQFADFLGGELKEDLDLWVSTSQSQLGIFTDECPHYNCHVTNRWNPHDSLTKKVVSEDIKTEKAWVYSDTIEGSKV